MSEDNKKDILDQIEEKIVDKREDYKTELLDEEPVRKSYMSTLIIVLIIAIGILIAGALYGSGIIGGNNANISIAEITNITKTNIGEKSDANVTISKKKIHVDVKDMENPTGMMALEISLKNTGKEVGKAGNFKVENKNTDDIIVRELEQANYESSEITPDGTITIMLTIAPKESNNTTEKNGEKYNGSFDIVFDSVK